MATDGEQKSIKKTSLELELLLCLYRLKSLSAQLYKCALHHHRKVDLLEYPRTFGLSEHEKVVGFNINPSQ